MKKRKLVALIMALTLAAALVNGCGDPGTGSNEQPAETGAAEGTETGTAQEEAAADPFGRYEEPVEVSSVKNLGAGIEFPEGESLEDNVWTRYLEETLNIRINWEWSTNTEQYAQKVNIAITSDDIPDVMQGVHLDKDTTSIPR